MVCDSSGTRVLRRVLHQPGLGEFCPHISRLFSSLPLCLCVREINSRVAAGFYDVKLFSFRWSSCFFRTSSCLTQSSIAGWLTRQQIVLKKLFTSDHLSFLCPFCALRYQVLYQVGVFVSRSSLCCMKIRKLWIFSFLQVRCKWDWLRMHLIQQSSM